MNTSRKPRIPAGQRRSIATHVYFTDSEHRALVELAAKNERTLSSFIRYALKETFNV